MSRTFRRVKDTWVISTRLFGKADDKYNNRKLDKFFKDRNFYFGEMICGCWLCYGSRTPKIKQQMSQNQIAKEEFKSLKGFEDDF